MFVYLLKHSILLIDGVAYSLLGILAQGYSL
jgi:hypothetical protein